MELLIVAATECELLPLPDLTDQNGRKSPLRIEKLITGVGTTAAAYALTKHLQAHKYDLVLQVGVAGSFTDKLSLGELVFVTSEQYGDLGAQDHDNYLSLFEIGLLEANTYPYTNSKLVNPMVHHRINLPHVSGLTVNTVSGNAQTIKMRREKFGADIESMEGAALHEICLREHMPFAQVRAISNYVIPRDKSQWKMKDAIVNLNNWLRNFIELCGSQAS